MPLKVKTMYNFPKIELFLDFKDHFALRDVLGIYQKKDRNWSQFSICVRE